MSSLPPKDEDERRDRPKWDLMDAAAVVCFDAGVPGVAAWVGTLAGPGAGPYLNVLVRPALILPVVILIARRWWGARPADLGVTKPRPGSWWWFLKFASLAGLGYLVVGGILAATFRGRVDVEGLHHGARIWLQTGAVIPHWVLAAMIVAPLVEELVYRGVLYPALRGRIGRGWAVLASAAIFALMHLVWSWSLFLPVTQFLGGLIFAWSYEKTRSLVFPVIFHAIGNAGVLAWMLVLAYRPGWVEAVLGSG